MESKEIIVFMDCGDTIIDESTEIRDDKDVVLKGDVIPGADVMIKTLAQRGYTLAIVADGLHQSFENLLTQHGIRDCFAARIYSEDVGVFKPHPEMFTTAMRALNLTDNDCNRIVMVGNNLSRDIKGANEIGITSIFLSWTPRYPKQPTEISEKPDYTISEPLELIDLIDHLNDNFMNDII